MSGAYRFAYRRHDAGPGTVIMTGTPPAWAWATRTTLFLKPGDTARYEIERLGALENTRMRSANTKLLSKCLPNG